MGGKPGRSRLTFLCHLTSHKLSNLTGFPNLLGGVLNLVLAFSSHFFNMSLIHKIVGVGTLCLQPGTGCGIVVL